MPTLRWSDLQQLPPPPAGRRIPYGALPDQFGDLRLPPGEGPHPAVVLIHGGCWRQSINLDHIAHLADALTREGLATWSIEYRRADSEGGGWPGTFHDVLAAFDHLAGLGVHTGNPVLAGHSAGGHLALWLASQRPAQVRAVASLSGIPDLRGAAATVCPGMIPRLVGDEQNYAKTSPIEMLPLRVPQSILIASLDDIVPAKWGEEYAAAARQSGDSVQLVNIPNAGHFEPIAPHSPAWPQVRSAILGAFAAQW